MTDFDVVSEPVSPWRCERCGAQDRNVRLYENGSPKREGWRLMPLHPACSASWQEEVAGMERDYGWWWLPSGQRARLSWRERDRQLYLHDPAVGDRPLLAIDGPSAENLLDGWADAHGDLGWLAERLALAGVQLRMREDA